MNETQLLLYATAAGTVLNAAALIYDVYKRYKKRSVSFVAIRNKNSGLEEFSTKPHSEARVFGTLCDWIKIKNDNTVELKRSSGQIECYSNVIKWKI